MKGAKQREVVVVGGGISGLTAAWRLKESGMDVCLLEAGPKVGGCTRTESNMGFLLEQGPFNVMVKDPSFEAMLEDLARQVHVVSAQKTARHRYILRHGALQRVPSNPMSLATTGLLSLSGRLRLVRGLCWSANANEPEETIGQAATRRIGREAADTFVSAVISGIFAGDMDALSLPACFPSAARFDREARSPLARGVRAMLAARKGRSGRSKRKWPGLVSFESGLGMLTQALGHRLGDDCMTNCVAEKLESVQDGYEIHYRSRGGDRHPELRKLRCRRVVVALPARQAGALLGPLVPKAAEAMGRIACASLAVVNLGFRKRDVGHHLNGFGFLVPRNEPDVPIMGALWADSMFPHHAPPDCRLIRVFVGGLRDESAVGRTSDQLVQSATSAVRALLNVRGDPVLVDVCRHRAAIPQYGLGHQARIQSVRTAIAAHQGLHVIGNYLEGVSLNDCIRLATATAYEIISSMGGDGSEAARPAGAVQAACPA